jgi:hypothetical protein
MMVMVWWVHDSCNGSGCPDDIVVLWVSVSFMNILVDMFVNLLFFVDLLFLLDLFNRLPAIWEDFCPCDLFFFDLSAFFLLFEIIVLLYLSLFVWSYVLVDYSIIYWRLALISIIVAQHTFAISLAVLDDIIDVSFLQCSMNDDDIVLYGLSDAEVFQMFIYLLLLRTVVPAE